MRHETRHFTDAKVDDVAFHDIPVQHNLRIATFHVNRINVPFGGMSSSRACA